MDELDDLWYNALTHQLGLNRTTFQISRPSPPLAASDEAVSDEGLWQYMDAVPPATLIFDRSQQEVARFSVLQNLLVNELRFDGESNFKTSIGVGIYRKWSEYLDRLTPRPSPDQLPATFFNWAMRHAPNSATVGASTLAQMVLPQRATAEGRPSAFEGTYREIRETLLSAKSAAVAFSTRDPAGGATGNWTKDARVEAMFHRYAVWPSKPGYWYKLAAIETAFENRGSPPWSSRPGFAWEDFFGPHGKLRQAIASLVVVDGITATITSDVVLTAQDRAELAINLAKGMWPFYVPDSDVAANSVTFEPSRGMRLQLITKPGNPAVIGNNIVGIAEYLRGRKEGCEGSCQGGGGIKA